MELPGFRLTLRAVSYTHLDVYKRQGLQMLGRTSNLGLKALMECTGIDRRWVNAYHIGFVLGPCLNASGRLDTAKRALNLLRSKSEKEAALLAGDLKALNDSRKDLTEVAVEPVSYTHLYVERKRGKFIDGIHPVCGRRYGRRDDFVIKALRK